MGARMELTERTLVVRGGPLVGAEVHAADLRAGGALAVAGMAAEGTTRVLGVESIDRGYERFAERLSSLGASVARVALPSASAPSATASSASAPSTPSVAAG